MQAEGLLQPVTRCTAPSWRALGDVGLQPTTRFQSLNWGVAPGYDEEGRWPKHPVPVFDAICLSAGLVVAIRARLSS